jgi:predicted nucleic acid-binding protein
VFLIDTDVISATAPTKASPREDVLEWLRERGDRVFLSTITLAELRRGIALLAGKGHRRKAQILEAWEAGLSRSFAKRILPVDEAVARIAGDLFGRAEARGYFPGLADACIAATAERYRLTIITANARHFHALGATYQPLWEKAGGGPL